MSDRKREHSLRGTEAFSKRTVGSPVMRKNRPTDQESKLLMIKRHEYLKRLKEIDDWLQKQNEDAQNMGLGHCYRAAASEHKFCEMDIKKRWSPEAPNTIVFGFGSDDMCQLGITEMVRKRKQDEHDKQQKAKKQRDSSYKIEEFDDTPEDFDVPTRMDTRFERGLKLKIIKVEAGSQATAYLTVSGRVYTHGCGDEGFLGRPVVTDPDTDETDEKEARRVLGFVSKDGNNQDEGIVDIVAGDAHMLCLSYTGELYMFGMYKDGDSGKFRDIGVSNPNAKDSKGFHAAPSRVTLMKDRRAVKIFSAGSKCAAILDDASMVTWGFGVYGDLARSASATQPTKDKDGHDVYDLGKQFMFRDKVVDGEVMELCEPKYDVIKKVFLTPQAPFYNISSPKDVVSVAFGSLHILVLAREKSRADTSVYSSGNNSQGQLGLGDHRTRDELTKIEALEGKNIRQIAAGDHFSLAMDLFGNRVWSWGQSSEGQLGGYAKSPAEKESCYNKPIRVRFPEIVQLKSIAAGSRNAFAVTTSGELYTWGDNNQGICGLREDTSTYFRFPYKVPLGDSAETESVEVDSVSAGAQHTVVLGRLVAKSNN